jgi:hypothetical protein
MAWGDHFKICREKKRGKICLNLCILFFPQHFGQEQFRVESPDGFPVERERPFEKVSKQFCSSPEFTVQSN